MKSQLLALTVATACLVPAALDAQRKPTSIYVGVVDKQGNPATGLEAADFRVREDGVAREVTSVAPATEPLTVAFLIDDSQVTQPSLQMIREAVDDFITALAGKAEIALVTFGERPTIVADYTTDQKKLHDAAKRIFPRQGAGAYLMDAIVEVSRGLQKREAKRPVIAVLMVDNGVEFSNRYYPAVLDEIDKSRAALHVVTLGSPADNQADEMRNRNQVIAIGTERTGGKRDNVISFTAAAQQMKKLAAELTSQYVVTYARPEQLIPPEKIDVSVVKPGLTARARTRNPEKGAR